MQGSGNTTYISRCQSTRLWKEICAYELGVMVRSETKKNNRAPVQEPRPSVSGNKPNSNIVRPITYGHNISTNGIFVIVHLASCASHDIKCMLSRGRMLVIRY